MPKRAKSLRAPLPRWQRWGIYGLTSALLLSGSAWLVCEHFIRIQAEFGAEHSPWQHRWLVLHGALAMPMLWLVGVLWTAHIKRGWVQQKNRITGGALIAVFTMLALSATLLYYLSDDQWRELSSVAHWVLGLALMVVLPGHIIWGRRHPIKPAEKARLTE
jgi:hypothetical protein